MVVASVVGEMQLKVTVRLYAADGSVRTLVNPDRLSNTGSKVGENGCLVTTYNIPINIVVDITGYVDDGDVVRIIFEGETLYVPVRNGAGSVKLSGERRLEVNIETL